MPILESRLVIESKDAAKAFAEVEGRWNEAFAVGRSGMMRPLGAQGQRAGATWLDRAIPADIFRVEDGGVVPPVLLSQLCLDSAGPVGFARTLSGAVYAFDHGATIVLAVDDDMIVWQIATPAEAHQFFPEATPAYADSRSPLHAPALAAEITLRAQVARLVNRCNDLESENRSLRAQVTVHRAASPSRHTEIDVTTVAQRQIVEIGAGFGVGSTRAYAKDGRQFVQIDADGSILVRLATGSEFRLSSDGLRFDSVDTAKPEDPRSAALARAAAGDRLLDGYAQ